MKSTRKSPKAARDANPDNVYRKAEREKAKKKAPKIVKMSKKEINATNKRLKEHFKTQKSSPHSIIVHGIGKK